MDPQIRTTYVAANREHHSIWWNLDELESYIKWMSLESEEYLFAWRFLKVNIVLPTGGVWVQQ